MGDSSCGMDSVGVSIDPIEGSSEAGWPCSTVLSWGERVKTQVAQTLGVGHFRKGAVTEQDFLFSHS